MSEWRMVLVALVLAACGNVRTSGESWLVGADGEKFLPESKVVGDNYAGPVLTIEPARPDGTDIHLADDQGPVALSIMLPASPGVGQSVEAVRMSGGCGMPGCLVYHGGAVQIDQSNIQTADWHTTSLVPLRDWTDPYRREGWTCSEEGGQRRCWR